MVWVLGLYPHYTVFLNIQFYFFWKIDVAEAVH